jgi:hypothetical protein
MYRGTPPHVAELPDRTPRLELPPETPADLVSSRCISCHTLERVFRYKGSDWDRVVGRMRAYGARLTQEEAAKVVDYLESGTLQEQSSFEPVGQESSP